MPLYLGFKLAWFSMRFLQASEVTDERVQYLAEKVRHLKLRSH